MTEPSEMDKKCKWTEDTDGYWRSECGDAFVFNEGTPPENGFNFCCFCGKEISVIREENV